MSQETWTKVDSYITGLLVRSDPALDSALAEAAAAGLPAISVSPAQGKLLQLLAQMIGANRILELGTLAGYSTIWMARALGPGGRLITLEADPRHAGVASANIARAGLSHSVEIRLGKAIETLPQLAEENQGPFDLIFIDADKVNIPEYFRWALRLSRPGGLILVDNVVRDGALADSTTSDPSVQGVQRLHTMLADEPRVSATTIQTVGMKGYDGITIAMVLS